MCVCAGFALSRDNDEQWEKVKISVSKDKALRSKLSNSAVRITTGFDYTVLMDPKTDVLFLGEYHFESNFKKETNIILRSLAQKNRITHFATEFFTVSAQPLIDDFYAGKITAQELQKQSSDSDYSAYGETSAVEVAKRYGLKTIALDLDKAQADYPWATTREGMNARNNAWAGIIVEAAQKNAGSSFIVYCGAYHSRYKGVYGSRSVSDILIKDKKLNVKVVEYTTDRVFADLAAEKQWREFPVLFKIPEEYIDLMNADFIIYIPLNGTLLIDKDSFKQKTDSLLNSEGFDYRNCTTDPDHPLCKLLIETSR
jgi:hypothetical protein